MDELQNCHEEDNREDDHDRECGAEPATRVVTVVEHLGVQLGGLASRLSAHTSEDTPAFTPRASASTDYG